MNGIWSYKSLAKVPKDFRLSLSEGNTPIKQLTVAEQLVMVKDENSNPNGSFKDRSLAYQISNYIAQGKTKFVISSSGNAAISAAAYVGLAGGSLTVFVSDQINPLKLAKLNELVDDKIELIQSKKAKSDAVLFAKENDCINLRGSQDQTAIDGFKTIAYEIIEQFPEIDSIFLPCSSGTSAIGIHKGFKEHKKNVRIFICQTTKICPMASIFDKDYVKSEKSFADAITDRVALRKDEVVQIVKLSGGSGIVVNDAYLYQAKTLAESQNLYYSYNSLLALAGFMKFKASANSNNQVFNPLVLASGL